MGLFSKKKSEPVQESLPPLKFPELPSIAPMEMQRPAQDMREAATIKQAVFQQPRPRMQRPEPMQEMRMEKHEQPLFIKVDTYNDLLDTLSTVKAKLADANHALEELSRLKEEEDRELNAWHSDLSAIKEKLVLVDQKLSE